MIYASFQSQYGIRLSRDLDTMRWQEFAYLINGLSGDSPLGRIVSIRAEDDPDVLKDFTKEQKQIRNEWRRSKAKTMDKKKADTAINGFRKAFLEMAKNNEKAEM